MAKILINEDDLGEAAQFVLDPADETLDPLYILLEREDNREELFFTDLERLLRPTFH